MCRGSVEPEEGPCGCHQAALVVQEIADGFSFDGFAPVIGDRQTHGEGCGFGAIRSRLEKAPRQSLVPVPELQAGEAPQSQRT